MTPPDATQLPPGLADEQSREVTVTSYDKANKAYVIQAATIDRYYNTRRLFATRVNITSFDSLNKITSTVVSDSAEVNEAQNWIIANGHVVFKSPNGILKTNSITWDRNTDTITAPGEVILIRDTNQMKGRTLRTNSKLDFAEMKQVTAEGKVNEKEINW